MCPRSDNFYGLVLISLSFGVNNDVGACNNSGKVVDQLISSCPFSDVCFYGLTGTRPDDPAKGVSTICTVLLAASLLLVGGLTSRQPVSVSQGRICSDKSTYCHTETEAAGSTFYLTRSQYTDTGPTGPSADSMTQDAWQGSHRSTNFLSQWYNSIREKDPRQNRESNPGVSLSRRTPYHKANGVVSLQ